MQVNYTKALAEYEKEVKKVYKKNGKIETKFYLEVLEDLYLELVKLQKWVIDNDKRLLIIFEGMDTGGKSSSMKALNRYWNPREARTVALSKPNSKELGQWYFQRHLKQIPNAGEIVCFDRSWYNRAGIEPIFGFCTEEEHELFYNQVNDVEKMLIDDGVIVFKFYLNISKETQSKRLEDREGDPLKSWKLSDLDYKSHARYDEYVVFKDKMFKKSGTAVAPWCMLDANDKKRARLNLIRFILSNINYSNRNDELITGVDEKILSFYG
ncbi:MAG: UDP-galactose-lipid carrier transferase (EC [uncultured Sulfurovum sp.]|uniref:ADP/GDP-polyphosphate phosphotransferase n=1 Tax=uncultured Sulfurovum sp. TaxID=269237 RepID=A0A6S6T4L6_9BACT|nr:MAG: UDP-galactose-lipid carrier transferase (EC [uncultured Sulfurovum sp.]